MHSTKLTLPTHLKVYRLGQLRVNPDQTRWLSYDAGDNTWPYLTTVYGVPVSGDEMEIPNFFDQITGGWETDVSHGKIVNLPTIRTGEEVVGLPDRYVAPFVFVCGSFVVTKSDGRETHSTRSFNSASYSSDGTSVVYRQGSSGWTRFGWLLSVTEYSYETRFEGSMLQYRYTVTTARDYYGSPEDERNPIPYPHSAGMPTVQESYTSAWYNAGYYPDVSMSWDMPPLFPGMHLSEPYFVRGYGPMPHCVQECCKYAVIQSLEDIPSIADNNIANAMDIISIVKDICFGNWGDIIPTTLRDLWMFYRYCYSTTKSDTKQALDYLSKQHVRYYSDMKLYGVGTHSALEYGIDTITCKVTYKIRKQTSDLANVLRNQLHEAGLEMTPYTLWDLIPFSFVVDWFVPVGDRLKLKDDIQHFEVDYLVSGTTWSLQYDYNHPSGYVSHHYTRWHAGIPALSGVALPSGRTSITTIAKRAVDTVCLVH